MRTAGADRSNKTIICSCGFAGRQRSRLSPCFTTDGYGDRSADLARWKPTDVTRNSPRILSPRRPSSLTVGHDRFTFCQSITACLPLDGMLVEWCLRCGLRARRLPRCRCRSECEARGDTRRRGPAISPRGRPCRTRGVEGLSRRGREGRGTLRRSHPHYLSLRKSSRGRRKTGSSAFRSRCLPRGGTGTPVRAHRASPRPRETRTGRGGLRGL